MKFLFVKKLQWNWATDRTQNLKLLQAIAVTAVEINRHDCEHGKENDQCQEKHDEKHHEQNALYWIWHGGNDTVARIFQNLFCTCQVERLQKFEVKRSKQTFFEEYIS